MAPKEPHSVEQGDKRKLDEVEGDGEASAEQVSSPEAKTDHASQYQQPPAKLPRTTSALDWLLSKEAFDLANPEISEGNGKIDWDPSVRRKTPPKDDAGKADNTNSALILRYPTSDLTPFQNLVSSSILSKPLSHKLGLRTIQTLLNPPFSLRTCQDLDEAGFEGRRKVMWKARTQHKERTATFLGHLCEGIKELCGEDADDLSKLTGVREKIKDCKTPKEAQEKLVEVLTDIKGIGPGVASIFLRRVQGDWKEVFPYIDDRSLKAAISFGLIQEGQGATELAEKVVKDQKQFVRLVDTLVGLELEKKVDVAMQLAGVYCKY